MVAGGMRSGCGRKNASNTTDSGNYLGVRSGDIDLASPHMTKLDDCSSIVMPVACML